MSLFLDAWLALLVAHWKRERDEFRGPFEEEEDAQIVEDDGDGDTFVDPDAEIEEDADATQLVEDPEDGVELTENAATFILKTLG